jgi:hypothetical protein
VPAKGTAINAADRGKLAETALPRKTRLWNTHETAERPLRRSKKKETAQVTRISRTAIRSVRPIASVFFAK